MTIYRRSDGSLEVREGWFGGLQVETRLGDQSITINMDKYEARDFLLELYANAFPREFPIGPAER
jgi:hypothetical protein